LHFMKAISKVKQHLGVSRRTLLKRYWRKLLAPQWLIDARRRGREKQEKTPPLANPLFAERIGMHERLKRENPKKPQSVRESQLLALNHVNVAQFNEITSRRGAMFGIEIRHPFMDKRLIEFCLALPGEMRLRDGWTRYIMRRAMEGIVPDKVTWRVGKANLGPSFSHGLLKTDIDLLKRCLFETDRLHTYLDMKYILNQFKRREELRLNDQTVLA